MTWLKRGLALAAFAVVLRLFWPLIGELKNAVYLFRQADWAWVAGAAALQVGSYAFLAALNYLLLRPFRGHVTFRQLLEILPAMAFIEVALPSAGASGLVLRARLLGRLGYSAEVSSFTLLLETLYLIAMMVGVSVCGLWYLLRSGEMKLVELAYLVGVAALIVGAAVAAFVAGRDRERALRWTLALSARWNALRGRFPRLPSQSPDAVTARLNRFYDGLRELDETRRWPLLAAAFGRVVLDVATLGACFAAFHHPVSLGVLLTGYGLTLLVSAMAVLPGGMGLADASLAVIYARLGAPGAVAIAASLTYRLIAFWLLRLVGFLCWQIQEAKR
jgi:uncharacterized protein (TIRG00374 family)